MIRGTAFDLRSSLGCSRYKMEPRGATVAQPLDTEVKAELLFCCLLLPSTYLCLFLSFPMFLHCGPNEFGLQIEFHPHVFLPEGSLIKNLIMAESENTGNKPPSCLKHLWTLSLSLCVCVSLSLSSFVSVFSKSFEVK